MRILRYVVWRKLALHVVNIIFVIGVFTACDQPTGVTADRMTLDSPIESPSLGTLDERAPVIVAFGDSLTAGLGVTAHQTYPAQLQNKLRQAALEYRVVNMGVNGETTAGALRRLEHVRKLRPALVILEFGANDGLRGLDIEQTHANLAQIIESFQAHDIAVLLTGMKLPPNYGPSFVQGFAHIFPALAEKYDIPLMPFFLEDVATKPALNQADGLHPTAQGYSVIVENLWPILLSALDSR